MRSLGASRFCIVVVDIHEECAAAYENRREHKRTEWNGEERRGREMNTRGGQRREQSRRKENRREEERKPNKKRGVECNGMRRVGECDVAEGLRDSTFLFPLSRSFLFASVLRSISKLKVLLEDRKRQVKRRQKLGSVAVTYPA